MRMKKLDSYDGKNLSTIPAGTDWRHLSCTTREFAAVIGKSIGLVSKLEKLGLLIRNGEGILFFRSLLRYCKYYLTARELDALIERQGEPMKIILSATVMKFKDGTELYRKPEDWGYFGGEDVICNC